jgi:hypothetical protein
MSGQRKQLLLAHFSYNLKCLSCSFHESGIYNHTGLNHVCPGHLTVEEDSMARTNRTRKNATRGVGLFTGLFIITVLACGGRTGSGNPQPEQKSFESGTKRTVLTGISQPQDRQQKHVLDEILVKFKPGTEANTIEEIRAALNLETTRKFSSPNLFLMKITDGSAVEAVIEKLKTYEAVKYAEPNYVVKATQ